LRFRSRRVRRKGAICLLMPPPDFPPDAFSAGLLAADCMISQFHYFFAVSITLHIFADTLFSLSGLLTLSISIFFPPFRHAAMPLFSFFSLLFCRYALIISYCCYLRFSL